MKIFLTISSIMSLLFGCMLLFMPIDFYKPTGMVLTPMLATLAQAHGATLFGLGIINWLARNAERQGLISILSGNLAVQVLSLGVVIHTMMLGAGSAAIPGIIIHVILGSLFAFFLIKTIKN